MSDMHASQRGSVLLTVIAGILILAVAGAAALSLMTGAVMTVVDGRETVQAAYLAESGKEIVRAQTASQSGGSLMQAAVSLTGSREENGGKGLAVDGTGFVRVGLYPSWFRWHDGKWDTTSLGWYGGAPAGNRAWLAMSSAGAYRYEGEAKDIDLGTAAADVYFIGRVDGTPVYSASSRTLSVRAKEGKDDFLFFPESGGLIGLVAKQTNEDKTTVSNIRFLYDTLEKQGNSYIFSNVTPFPESVGPETITAALKGHDVALGQYFRVECESVTDYGARSALVWHTNGRNSLRYADNGGSGGEGVAVGGNNADDLKEIFDGKVEGGKPKDEGLVQGDNIMGNLQKDDDELEWDFDDDDDDDGGNINGANKDKIEINHFLKRGNAEGNQEYWWVAIASQWLAYEAGNPIPLYSKMQYSFKPDDDDENYFSGILCRLAFVKSFNPPQVSSVGTVQQEKKGAKGIGVGVMQGEIIFHNNKDEVKTASVNPALLPGFHYEKKSGNEDKDKGVFTISAVDRAKWYGPNGLLRYHSVQQNRGHDKEKDGGVRIALYPLLVVWAYDDLEENKGSQIQSLRPLAVAVLEKTAYLNLENENGSDDEDELYLSLTVEVEEKDVKNHLKIWLEKNRESRINIKDDIVPWPSSGENFVKKWDYMAQEVYQGADGSLSTSFATGEAYRRVGIFSEAYAFKNMNDKHADIKIGNFFFTGTGSGGGSLFPGGLTPGIVN